jgi:PAS domain S-box-containing protein
MSHPTRPKAAPDGKKRGRISESISERFSAFEALSDGVSAVDSRFTVIYMNGVLKARYGDLTGKKCFETPLGSDEICLMCPIKSDWDFEKSPYLKRIVDPDGSIFEVRISKTADAFTGEPYWISVARDITKSVETESRLAVLAKSIDQMSEPVCVSDAEGAVMYVNRAYEALTGYDEKSVAGLSITETSTPGAPAGTMQTIMKAAATKGWIGEMTGLRKDGTRYYTHVEAKPVKTEVGEVIGVVGILQDVTRQKTEKSEIEKYTSELESKMESRTAELAKRVSQLTTINKISRVVTSLLDLDELINDFVKAIAQGFGYRHVSMLMVDKERGDLYFKAGYGWKMDSVPKDMRMKLKEGIIGHAAYFGETLVSGDVETDPRYVRKELIGTKSELSVPVTFRGEIIGVLDVQSEVKDAFTRNDVSTLEMLADMLATSITNARIYTESKEREVALSVLDRISKQISYRLEPEVVLDQVVRDATVLLKAEKATVGLLDDSGKSISFVASYRFDKDLLKSKPFSAFLGVTGRALKSLKAEVVNDYLSDPDSVESDAELFGIKSIVSAPLTIEGRGTGVINVYNKLGGNPFTKSDMLFLSSLADHAAIALENSSLLSSLNQRVHSQLALLDIALTMQRQIDSSSVYDIVADKLREVVWCDGITFYRLDREKKTLQAALSKGPYAKEIMAEVFSVDVGITGCVARTGKAERINDALRDPRVVQVAGTPVTEEAVMAIPLVGKDRVIGVLTLYRDGVEGFTSTEFEVAQLFASQASVAVENSELYRTRETLLMDSRRKVEQMAKVLELTSSVMYMDDLGRLLQRVADAVVQSFGFRRASVRTYDVTRDVFVTRGLCGFPNWVKIGEERPGPGELEDLVEKNKIGPATYYVPYEKQPYGIEAFQFLAHPELADKPRASPDSWQERDLLLIAMKNKSGQLSGYLLVDEPNDLKIPSREQLEMLEILAGIASIALDNSRVYERQVGAANEIALLNDLMTHDINNFNQGIMGYIELLLQDKHLDDNQRKYAERALLQVRNNARLIDNIRKLAKIRIMSDSDFEPMDVQKAVAEAIDSVTKATSDRKVTIVSALAPNAHYVMANQFINDLFLNVISNAVKFDVSKRVRVDVTISDETTSQGDYWIVSVVDRGRGIPDDRKSVVFERFATGMTGIKGFGLGLSIVSAVVEKVGGRIWVEDRIKGDSSRGTVFKIALPKASPPASQPDAKPSPATQ